MIRVTRPEPPQAGGALGTRWHHLLLVCLTIVMLSMLCASP